MSLYNDPLVIEIIKRFDVEIADISAKVSDGRIDRIEDYKKQCGHIYGLKRAKLLLEEAIKKFTDDED